MTTYYYIIDKAERKSRPKFTVVKKTAEDVATYLLGRMVNQYTILKEVDGKSEVCDLGGSLDVMTIKNILKNTKI